MNNQFDDLAKGLAQSVTRTLLCLAVAIGCLSRVSAQVQQAWVARYPNATPSALKVDSAGNVFVVGPSATES